MRKLASIQRIKSLEPIKDADSIQKATVLGWQLVVKKDEFKVGDLVVYCEIDSVLPKRPEFEFLAQYKYRIKTIKLRGQVSQGICFPLSVLPNDFEIKEGADCTQAIGVTLYEPPIPASLSGKMKGRFPSFIPKTDETRVQTLQELLDQYKGEACYLTEKLDGSSATYFIKDGEFGVCSRNIEFYEDDENTFWKVARQLDLPRKMASLNRNIALQGELVGENIQSNKLKLRGQTVYFFNAFDIDKYEYLPFDECIKIIKQLGLNTVPIIADDYILENDIEKLVETATIRSQIHPKSWAEGIVFRLKKHGKDQPFNENGRISFKVINPKFLLKYNE